MDPEQKKTIIELLEEELKKQEEKYKQNLPRGKEFWELKLIRDKIKRLRTILKNLKNKNGGST
jgi:hypothetical protein